MSSYPSYPVFKGMQNPFEFMGIRGKFIYYAGGLFLGGFLSFVAFNVLINIVAGAIGCAAVVIPGLAFIYIKQKQGLHNKKRYRGMVHPTTLWKH